MKPEKPQAPMQQIQQEAAELAKQFPPSAIQGVKPEPPKSIYDIALGRLTSGQSNSKADIFILHSAGIESPVVAIGVGYEPMWADALARTGQPKADLLKSGYTFDVVTAAEAVSRAQIGTEQTA